jgi:hypothetical protein
MATTSRLLLASSTELRRKPVTRDYSPGLAHSHSMPPNTTRGGVLRMLAFPIVSLDATEVFPLRPPPTKFRIPAPIRTP